MKKLMLVSVAAIAMLSFAFIEAAKDEKVTIIITHEVKDFATWKIGYDADAPNRTAAGLKVLGLYRSIDNPNVVTLSMEAPNADVAKGFSANPNLKAAMEKAGVISAPDFKFLSKVQ